MSHKVKQIFVSDSKKRLFLGALTLCIIFFVLALSGFSVVYLFYKNADIKNKIEEVKRSGLAQNNNTTVFYDAGIPNAYNGLSQNIYNINRVVFDILKYRATTSPNQISKIDDFIHVSNNHLSAKELIKAKKEFLKEYTLISENTLVRMLSFSDVNDYLINLAKDQDLSGFYFEINNSKLNNDKKMAELINSLKLNGLEVILLTSNLGIFDIDFIEKFDLLSINFANNFIKSNGNNFEEIFSKNILNSILELRNSKKYIREVELVIPTFSIDYTIYADRPAWKEFMDAEKYYKILKQEDHKYRFDKKYNSGVLSYSKAKDVTRHKVFIADDVALYNFLNKNIKNLGPVRGVAVPNIGSEVSDIWPLVLEFNKNKTYNLGSDFEISYVNEVSGKGVFYELEELNKIGKRNLYFDSNQNIKNVFVLSNPEKAKIKRSGYSKGKISLTFDDGPDPNITPKVLNILKEKNIKATFFITGQNAVKFPDLVKKISNDGHIIGNHSYTHPNTSHLNTKEISLQMDFTNKAIGKILGFEPKYYRTPFTSFGEYTVKNSLVNLIAAKKNNLIVQEVDVNSSDWLIKTEFDIINSVIGKIESGHSSQILFHDFGGDRLPTIGSLPVIIDGIIKNKYSIISSASAFQNSNGQKTINDTKTLHKEDFYSLLISFGNFIQKYIIYFATLVLSIEIIKVLVGFSLFFKHSHKRKEEELMSSDFTYPRRFNYRT